LARRLVLILLLALAAAAPAGAAKPSARAMVLTKDDVGPGALTLYQGTKIAAVFAPVVRGLSISDRYSRTLTDARLGPLTFPQLYSSAFVVASESQLASLVRDLTAATVPGVERRAFVAGMQSGAGSDVKVSLVRARRLKLGDDAVELIVHLKMSGGTFELAEIWIRRGDAVSAAAAVSAKPLTAGQSFMLAKLVAGRLKSALPAS
jgi:hypothetical protein